jgi:hypothetical protein
MPDSRGQQQPGWGHLGEIELLMEAGSVITRDNGVKVLAAVASTDDTYRKAIFPYLVRHVETCRPKDVPQHSASIVIAVNASTREDFLRVLDRRMTEMTGSQATRLRKVAREAEKRAAA